MPPPRSSRELLEEVLARYPDLGGAHVEPIRQGLINASYRVAAGPERRFVLQRLSPIFPPEVNRNLKAVTDHLAARGLLTPRLLPTRDGELWVDAGPGGIWRLLSHIEGASFDTVQSLEQARAAGRLVGRFHGALEDLRHEFRGLRTGVHDTARHIRKLRLTLAERQAHRLHGPVSRLGAEILEAAEALPPLPALEPRVGHGDLKLNNLRFGGLEPPARDRALCLVDLDTLGPISLTWELGDAWRSWCNPAGEDARESRFDLEVFRESLAGWLEGRGPRLDSAERTGLLLGVEWVSLELAARFAADALEETYFGWDRARFPGRGEHNLARAESQWALHRSARACRPERAACLGL